MVAPNEEEKNSKETKEEKSIAGGFSPEELAALIGKMQEFREENDEDCAPSESNPLGLLKREREFMLSAMAHIGKHVIEIMGAWQALSHHCAVEELRMKRKEQILGNWRMTMKSLWGMMLTQVQLGMTAVDPVTCKPSEPPTKLDSDD